MDTSLLQALVAEWRKEADLFRRRGLEEGACVAEGYAADLETRLREWWLEELSLEQAAQESGMAYDTLQRKLSRGDLPNAGRRGAPRILRSDLHGSPSPSRGSGTIDLAGEILQRRKVK